ncbi:methylated-DNA--[protein]-cysteine S-methyltransferase [Pontibacter burrus]|uniref:Methylated-DNA--protein-cysteine methyltransferase n=1 Tax=Pontibacter burrus TaxID=2704466 RepID=A0A6B3LX28_9BACT|nr:methylated-DNA--[protein]-cysteine S-methyltransferase [Pontibacter burrus]NEM98037.1 methylated-DNA--[protein]-cysteine S-methyltransferase [Pontibacter burrus]
MLANFYTSSLHTPIGYLNITTTDTHLVSCLFSDVAYPTTAEQPVIMQQTIAQLTDYFAGKRKEFDLPLQPEGTDFQKKVWGQLNTIAFGKTASYMDVAKAVSGEKAIRAVGAANGRNPICLIVPCHRVIGSDGSLTGYAGGLWRKEWLLNHEGIKQPARQLTFF